MSRTDDLMAVMYDRRVPEQNMITDFTQHSSWEDLDKLLKNALWAKRYQLADLMYDSGGSAPEVVYKDFHRMNELIVYGIQNKAFLYKMVRDFPKLEWVNAMIHSLNNLDDHLDTFFEVLGMISSDLRFDPKRGMYVVPVTILNNLIMRGHLFIGMQLIESGKAIPDKGSIKAVHRGFGGPPQLISFKILYCILEAKNTRSFPSGYSVWHDTAVKYHDSARKNRTLSEIAVIKCAKAGLPFKLPTPVSWHLRQDLYAIEKIYKSLALI